jgi:FemAB-related protein (PEP-CTERM system-associated)
MVPTVVDKPAVHARSAEEPRGACKVCAIEPAGHADWDAYVEAHPGGTLFHMSSWMEAVQATFGHQTLYLCASRRARCCGVLPLCCVRSRLGGTMLVSVPYAVYGGPLVDDAEAAQTLLDAAREWMARLGADWLDLRTVSAIHADLPVDTRYVTFRRELPQRPGDVLGWLPRKARAAARNARDKHRLTAEFDDSHLHEVWHLYCRSMRRLASLNYPYRFFKELIERTPGRHLVSLIHHEGAPVAGLVTFLHRGTALPYFVGADDRRSVPGLHNFIYLTAMERAVEFGCCVFDFGRSRHDNTGCVDFKRFQGFEPTVMEYQRLAAPGRPAPDLTPTNPRFRLARRIWPRLPLTLTRPLGAWVSRHVPG